MGLRCIQNLREADFSFLHLIGKRVLQPGNFWRGGRTLQGIIECKCRLINARQPQGARNAFQGVGNLFGIRNGMVGQGSIDFDMVITVRRHKNTEQSQVAGQLAAQGLQAAGGIQTGNVPEGFEGVFPGLVRDGAGVGGVGSFGKLVVSLSIQVGASHLISAE